MTFWAFAEIVKAQAGILETDSAHVAAERLRASVMTAVSDLGDAEWVERHLRPLVGLGGEPGDQREAFAAWRRYVAGVARYCGLLVLAFEDLHWADDGILDLVEHFAAWSTDVPLAIVCTARPELLERRPKWRAVRTLEALTSEETVALLGSLLEETAVRGDIWPRLLAHAAGNPLYAEEYARMLIERPAEGELRLPDSLQALIAARLDALSPDGKAVLQHASIVGKAFWVGALAHVAGLPREEVEARLGELARKALVHAETRSAVAEEAQYAFAHVLIRDIAYGQIPRARRADMHRLAGDWIAALAPDRAANLAEMTAHHYASALEFANLSRQPIDELQGRARLGAPRGRRPRALAQRVRSRRAFLRARARAVARRRRRSASRGLPPRCCAFPSRRRRGEELETARARLLESGDLEVAAEADVLLAELAFRQGDLLDAFARLERAVALLAGEPSSRQKAYVLSTLSRFRAAAYESEEAIRLGREALAMAEALGLDEIRAHALNNIGHARVTLGDREGVRDLEQSVEISDETGSLESVRGRLNLGTTLAHLGDLERTFAVHADGRRAAERFGDATGIRWFAIERLYECYWRGLWDEGITASAALLAEVEGAADYYTELGARLVRGWIRLGRGDLAAAQQDVVPYVALGREVKYPQALFRRSPSVHGSSPPPATRSRRRDTPTSCSQPGAQAPSRRPRTGPPTSRSPSPPLDRGEEMVASAAGVAHPTPWLEAASAFAAGDEASAMGPLRGDRQPPGRGVARLRSGEGASAAHAFVRRVAGADGYAPASFPSATSSPVRALCARSSRASSCSRCRPARGSPASSLPSRRDS